MDDENIIETETPVKEKKLKQARLPFQILSSTESSKSSKPSDISPTTNKKRKLSSPLPNESKNLKMIKMSINEIEETNISESENNIESRENNVTENEIENKKSKTPFKSKSETKTAASETLTRFLVRRDKDLSENKTQVNSDKSCKEETVPIITDNVSKEGCTTNVIDVEMCDVSDTRTKENIEVEEEKENNELKTSNDIDDSTITSDEETELEVSQNEDVDNSEDPNKSSISTINVNRKSNILDGKKLTPKQIQKQIEREKKIAERRQMRMEKERKREEERENRRKEKEEKRREKEEKEKADREQKKKEKEQKQKEKEALEKRREEEKRKKKEAKEEEERKKEEEKLEAERKKQKTVSNFIGFFVAKKPESKNSEQKQETKFTNFMPFEVKTDMRIAPINRRFLSEEEKNTLDELREKSNVEKSNLYLQEIKNCDYVKRQSGKTFPLEMKDDDDVVIIEEDDDVGNNVVGKENIVIEKHRPKLLYFCENQRPPYWGTWRKKSKIINSRKPLAKDNTWFDYTIDSDDEWEEEEPGESLHGSDDEKDEDNNPEENEYDVDNEFMVPHGYLSDEEIRQKEEEEEEGEDEEEDASSEIQKFKLKVLGEEFEAERNEKTINLKPKIIGCIWLQANGDFSKKATTYAIDILTNRRAWMHEASITIPAELDNDHRNVNETTPSSVTNEEKSARSIKKKQMLEEAVPHMIRLLHGNINNRNDLYKEFNEYWNRLKNGEQSISKRSFLLKLRELAAWQVCTEKGPMFQKFCWYVPEKIRNQYLGEENLEMPNKWSYIFTPKRKVEEESKSEKEEKKNLPLITQFAKKITQEEMKKQLTDMKVTTTPVNIKPPRRIALTPVDKPHKSPQVKLLDRFVSSTSTSKNEASVSKEDNDDDITILESDDENKS